MHMYVRASVLGILLSACSGDSPSEPGDISGVYALESVDGVGLPAIVLDEPPDSRIEVTSGVMELKADGSFRFASELRWIVTGLPQRNITREHIGTYSSNGTSFTFDPTNADEESFSGQLNRDLLTVLMDFDTDEMTLGPDRLIFRR